LPPAFAQTLGLQDMMDDWPMARGITGHPRHKHYKGMAHHALYDTAFSSRRKKMA